MRFQPVSDLSSGAETTFSQNVMNMNADRARRHEDFVCDFAIGAALSQQLRDFQLTSSEQRDRLACERSRSRVGREFAGNRARARSHLVEGERTPLCSDLIEPGLPPRRVDRFDERAKRHVSDD